MGDDGLRFRGDPLAVHGIDGTQHRHEDFHEHDAMESEGIASKLSKKKNVEIVELDKSGNIQQRWLHTPDGKIVAIHAGKRSHSIFYRSMREWRKVLFDAFLPVGFPHSVSDDYLAYQTYDSLQAFFSTIVMLLANRALLEGLGVGDADSSATAATLLTILKAAMSRVATIAFAYRFGLRIEPEAKKYRYLADLFNDTALFLELYSPYLGPWGKVVFMGTAETLKALCGVAAGASKAALSMHFAKHDNLAELNAKEASQETAVGLLGLLAGTVVVKYVQDHRSVVYLTSALVLIHLLMNYLGVCSVRMNTLNRQRATILFGEYLETGKVLSPRQVAAREHIITWRPLVKNYRGFKVARLCFAQDYLHAMRLLRPFQDIAFEDGPKHTLCISSQPQSRPIRVTILLADGAQPKHAVVAWFFAMEAMWTTEQGRGYAAPLSAEDLSKDAVEAKNNVQYKSRHADDEELWRAMAAAGWNLDAQAFETHAPFRVSARVMDQQMAAN